jgi:uncharacterized membrane protein
LLFSPKQSRRIQKVFSIIIIIVTIFAITIDKIQNGTKANTKTQDTEQQDWRNTYRVPITNNLEVQPRDQHTTSYHRAANDTKYNRSEENPKA